ncbi:MAG: biopolymer transporter ExbD [Pirellulaceae bacterium]
MRFRKSHETKVTEGDLTPMIDMTFQLIAFFMVLINFTKAEQDQRITLPSSVLAKPPETALEDPLFLHITKESDVVVGGQLVSLPGLKSVLVRESDALKLMKKSPSDSIVILRADAQAKTGDVQKVIQLCQESGFEQFALRAQEELR